MCCLIRLMLFVLLLPGFLTAQELPDGDDIALKINARDEGQSAARNVSMKMTDRRGKIRRRETRSFSKYYGADKRLAIFFLKPKNIKDTAFLTWNYADESKEDAQWLYLPAMRKVRRISAADRGDYFLGTDLTYEDMKLGTHVSIPDYSRRTIGIDKVDGFHCYIVEATPVNKKIAAELGYSKVEQCVDSKIWIIRRAKFWDIAGNLLKTAYFSDIHKVQGIWTQHQINVENHKTGHKTRLIFTDIDYQTEVRDDLFNRNSLRRGL